MAMESTQPLTEMSTSNFPERKFRPALKANLISIREPIVYKMREPRRLTTSLTPTACYRVSFTFFVRYKILSTFERFISSRPLLKLLRQSVSLYIYGEYFF
jgi:hypothetical protein